MSAARSRKEEYEYKAYLKTLPANICVFCTGHNEKLIEDHQQFKVIRNIFAYSLWDGQKVIDHLMITPKAHIDSVASFTQEMVPEFHKLMSTYESKGYNVYLRAPTSKIKSVTHQHTHLIKTEGAAKQVILHSRKPYLRFTT